jgi:hypothetical protein
MQVVNHNWKVPVISTREVVPNVYDVPLNDIGVIQQPFS